jgi:hypothetical protein
MGVEAQRAPAQSISWQNRQLPYNPSPDIPVAEHKQRELFLWRKRLIDNEIPIEKS